MDGTEFTIFFEDPFWIGVVVTDRRDRRFVARVVFGAEPTNAELLLFMRERFADLLRRARPVASSGLPSIGPAVAESVSAKPAKAMSAKRGIRLAAREQRSGPSKAMAAAHAAFELAKAAGRSAGAKRGAETERRFKEKQEKKKKARRGK